jgi:hypothetical protein
MYKSGLGSSIHCESVRGMVKEGVLEIDICGHVGDRHVINTAYTPDQHFRGPIRRGGNLRIRVYPNMGKLFQSLEEHLLWMGDHRSALSRPVSVKGKRLARIGHDF